MSLANVRGKLLLLMVFSLLYWTSECLAQEQPPRAFPSVRWGWYISSTPESDWYDEQGRLVMTKQQIVEWMADHTDWYLAGPLTGWESDIIWQRRPGIPIDYYAEWFYINSLHGTDWKYTTVPSAPTRLFYLEQALSQHGVTLEDFHCHVGVDTIVEKQSKRLFIDMFRMVFRVIRLPALSVVSSSELYKGTASSTIPANADQQFVFGNSYPITELEIEFNTPASTAGEFVLEYSSARDSDFVASTWTPVTIISDTTNGFTQDGKIIWQMPASPEWVPCKGFPSAFFQQVSYYLRIRPVDPASHSALSVKGMRCESWVNFFPMVVDVRNAVYVGNTSPFASVFLELRRNGVGGAYVMEYPTGVDSSGNAFGWTALQSVVDGTRGLTQPGTITWSLPSNWVEAPVGVHTTRKLYWIRIRAASAPSTPPIVQSAFINSRELPNRFLAGDRYAWYIPGWDPANDRNGDGYVDDEEFSNLTNPYATARRRMYSRAVRSGWEGALNFWFNWKAPGIGTALRDFYYVIALDNPRATGLYCDSQVVSGPPYPTVEYPVPPTGLQREWEQDWSNVYALIRTGGKRVGGNTSTCNMYAPFQDWYAYLNRLPFYTHVYNDYVNREGYLHGFSNLHTSIAPASLEISLAHGRGVIQMLQSNLSSTLASALSATTTATGLQRFKEHSLALYYLLMHPQLTYLNIHHGYYYNVNIWGAPIGRMPRQMAYQPTAMMQVDIGTPANYIPSAYQPVQYQFPFYDYDQTGRIVYRGTYNVGDTTSTAVPSDVPMPFMAGAPLYPTYSFVLATGTNPNSRRSFTVFARRYTKGLVVLKVMASGYNSSDVSDASLTTHSLPEGPYRRINWDGSLSGPITEISLRGMEGAILVKDEPPPSSTPDVQITVSADKTNPRPLDVVSITIVARNNGNAEAHNVRIQHNIPAEATYVMGSLKVNGTVVSDPADRTKIDVTIPSIPAGGQATVQFQMVIR